MGREKCRGEATEGCKKNKLTPPPSVLSLYFENKYKFLKLPTSDDIERKHNTVTTKGITEGFDKREGWEG